MKRANYPNLCARALAVTVGFSAALISGAALAVTEQEAATVVGLIETLEEELGDFAYDEEIAAYWFEQDAESRGLIEAAGFTEASWKRALGETYRGFLANVPEAELLQTFADARRRVAATESLTPEQKKQVLQFTAEKEREMLRMRAEGKVFASAVRPVAGRIRALSKDGPDQN